MIYYNIEKLKKFGINKLERKRLMLIIFGVVSMVAGILCFSRPVASTVILSIVLGVLFIFDGVLYIAERLMDIKIYSLWSLMLGILLGILYIYLGWQFLSNPRIGIITLAYLIGIGFLIAGVIRVVIGFSSTDNKLKIFFVFFTAVMEIMLGILLIISWPANSILLVSFFLGMEFICNSVNSFIAGIFLNKLIKSMK